MTDVTARLNLEESYQR